MRDTPVQAGGGRDRASMVAQARQAIEEGSQSFAAASKLFDQGRASGHGCSMPGAAGATTSRTIRTRAARWAIRAI